jgi:hypothetical protein
MSLSFASTVITPSEFRDRSDKARRSGNPAWLWPEVPVAAWADAMGAVAKAVSAVLAVAPAELPALDPLALSLACYTSGVGPLLGWWAEQGLLDGAAEARELVALHLQHARTRASATGRPSQDLVSALTKAAIPVIVLKGGHTAQSYFPDPATRPSSDLDLLVPANRSDDAETVLSSVGLQCVARDLRESSWARSGTDRTPRHLWLIGEDDPWSVDLHRSLDFAASVGARVVRFDEADPFTVGEPWSLDPTAHSLRQPLLLLHLAVHASGGLQSLTLLRMVEIILVVRQDTANQRLSWDEFIALGARIGALGAVYPALAMSEKLAPGTIPSGVLRICRELAPRRTRSVVDKLDPANVQRIDRASVAEHFMWIKGPRGWTRQLWADLTAGSGSLRSRQSIYQARIYRLLRGRITR